MYLGAHSPCDVLAGWVLGCLILFIFSGFSDRLHQFYAADVSAPFYLTGVTLVLLAVHPRSWPETQSYGEVRVLHQLHCDE